jgi:hypothetical protein
MVGAGLILAMSVAQTLLPSAHASDLLKYMQPVSQKNNYLNKSQDREIKKKGFKTEEVEGAQPISNREIGLFATVDSTILSHGEQLTSLIQDPHVNGLSVLLSWQQLEPTEGQFDWQPIDKLLELCQNNNKSLILRISTSGGGAQDQSETPKWVYDAGASSVDFTGIDGKQHAMPIFWNPIYLAKWSNFVTALGKRYDNNPALQSVGITGGGMLAATPIVSGVLLDKAERLALEKKLEADKGMNEHQVVEHWKYVADLFPRAFIKTRLNFDVDAPLDSKSGQSMLDEISDYLVYKYGERVYLTRLGVDNSKHGFDQYRILLKFRNDTLTGYQLSPAFNAAELDKLTKVCLDDGISFVEIPAALILTKDATVLSQLDELRAHLGYQLISQSTTLPADLKSGSPLTASFTFVNLGSSPPMRPNRELDKDLAGSYKIQLELRDADGKPVVQSLHTPGVPTNQWIAGKPIKWEQELKMPKLKPGEYSVWLSLIDVDNKRKLQILNGADECKDKQAATSIDVGKVQVVE